MTVAVDTLLLLAPVSGVLVPLDDVPDPVFAQRLVGDGVSIDPLGARVVAPCDGEVLQVHRAGHAVTIGALGLEIVIHVGLDTVGLGGDGFTPLVRPGERVRAGDPLIDFDADAVARRARSLLTQMVVSTSDRAASMRAHTGRVRAGADVVLEVRLRQDAADAVSAPVSAPASARAGAGATIAESPPITIEAPLGIHARPAALLAAAARRFTSDVRLVKDGREANVRSVVSIMAIEAVHGDVVRVVARGDDASEAVEAVARVIAEIANEAPDAHAATATRSAGPSPEAGDAGTDARILRGVGASPGAAVGTVFQLRHEAVAVQPRAADPNHERRELDAAIAAAHLQLEALEGRLAAEADAGHGAIFSAHQELLEDPEVLDRAAEAIRGGASAAFAWQQAFTAQAERLTALRNPLLAARAADLRDVGRRVLHLLTGHGEAPHEVPDGAIVVAEELTPSDTAALHRTKVRGLCTTMGSATSHVAILARGFGIPAVAGIDPRALDLPNGTSALLDGDAGTLRLDPTAEEQAGVAGRRAEGEQRYRAAHAAASEPALTTEQHRVEVVANIGAVSEAERVAGLGGEGVGLLRTEFLFMERRTAPTEDEQAESYGAIARALDPGAILVVRTLDVGGDKPLPYLGMPAEANPFLGERGIRLTMGRPELFRAQVRAILRASAHGRVAIMFPMIATVAEWRSASALVERERRALGVARIPVGIMVETAAAALMAERFAREADFLSIGTNDLTQYTLAMDRTNPRLAPQVDALHPAVLRLIAMTVAGGHAHGRWVGVCGALAAEPHAVPLLVGMGVDELSVDLPLIPMVKAQVRTLSLEQCRTTAHEALAAADGTEVRQLVERRHG